MNINLDELRKAEIRQKIENLKLALDTTTDLNEKLSIMSEIGRLSNSKEIQK